MNDGCYTTVTLLLKIGTWIMQTMKLILIIKSLTRFKFPFHIYLIKILRIGTFISAQ